MLRLSALEKQGGRGVQVASEEGLLEAGEVLGAGRWGLMAATRFQVHVRLNWGPGWVAFAAFIHPHSRLIHSLSKAVLTPSLGASHGTLAPARWSGFESQQCLSSALWTHPFMALCLSFPIHKVGGTVVPRHG